MNNIIYHSTTINKIISSYCLTTIKRFYNTYTITVLFLYSFDHTFQFNKFNKVVDKKRIAEYSRFCKLARG